MHKRLSSNLYWADSLKKIWKNAYGRLLPRNARLFRYHYTDKTFSDWQMW